MPPAVRRPAPQPPAPQGVNFFDDAFYTGGFVLSEGDYALAFEFRLFAGTRADGSQAGEPRLGVMVSAYPLTGGEAQEQFYSMGGKAALSFAPGPDGKTLSPIPGGPSVSVNNKTNWSILRKSFIDCALPAGVVTDSLTPLDGIWCHMTQVPEPEDRKGFGAKTGDEAEQPANQGPKMIAVCSEILEGGKPWEGTGGFDFQPVAAAPAARPGPKPVARPAAAPARPAAPAVRRPAPVAAPVAEETDTEELGTIAVTALGDVLSEAKNAMGCTKVTLRVGTFKAIEKKYDQAKANEVINTYFANDEELNGLLGQVGYGVSGPQVKPLA